MNRILRFHEKYFYLIYTTIFLLLSILLIIRHEFWRDEITSWHLGSESSSFCNFIENMKKNVGHPFLWFYILYLISHYITTNPESMKIIHLAISSISIFLILKYAPFNKPVRVLLIFSYFFFFEYSIISRNYAIGVLFAILFCVLYKYRHKNLILLSIILFFTGQAVIHSFIISLIMAIMLLIDLILDREHYTGHPRKTAIIISIFIILGSIFFTYWQLGSQGYFTNNEAIISLITTKGINDIVNGIKDASSAIIYSYTPILLTRLNFWNSNLIINFLSGSRFIYTFLVAIFLGIFPIFIIKRRYLFLYIVGILSIQLFIIFVFDGSVRHYGFLFLILLIGLWLSNLNTDAKYLVNINKRNMNKRIQTIFLSVILIFSLSGSITAYYFDWKYPFSNAKYVAEYIQENFDEESLIIVGYKDYAVEPIAGYLDKDIYYPNFKEFRKLVSWKERSDNITLDDVFIHSSILSKNDNEVLVIINYDILDDGIYEKYSFKKLKTDFTISVVRDEHYYLYLSDKTK